jgi:hypothetical protein
LKVQSNRKAYVLLDDFSLKKGAIAAAAIAATQGISGDACQIRVPPPAIQSQALMKFLIQRIELQEAIVATQ